MNKLYKSLIYDREVSLSVIESTQLVNDAIKIHNLDDKSAKTLGSLLTCAAFMAGCLKSERGAVSLTVKGNGDAGTVSVSGDKDLHIRGYIDGACEGRINGGYLTVVKEDGFFRPFVGASELVGDSVSENLMQYFHASEQIETAVAIDAKIENGKCVAAGGVIMQLMPGCSEENMDRAEECMQNFVDIGGLLQELGADGIMQKFFAGEATHLYGYFPEYRCNCSRKKIEGIILSIGKDECGKIIDEEGAVKVHCDYCNKTYEFTRKDIDNLYDEKHSG